MYWSIAYLPQERNDLSKAVQGYFWWQNQQVRNHINLHNLHIFIVLESTHIYALWDHRVVFCFSVSSNLMIELPSELTVLATSIQSVILIILYVIFSSTFNIYPSQYKRNFFLFHFLTGLKFIISSKIPITIES